MLNILCRLNAYLVSTYNDIVSLDPEIIPERHGGSAPQM